MKRIFTFIAAMLVAFAASAATININTGTADALRLALNSANDGDEIVMAAGTYVESNADYIKIDGKSVVVRAALDAEVILQAKVPVILKNGGRVEFVGIKFDASLLNSDPEHPYAHAIYSEDNASGNKLILDDCEFYGFNVESGSFIHSASDAKMDSCIVNNCYIHDITKSFLFFEEGSLIGIKVTNSTFANVAAGAANYYASLINPQCTGATVIVDHCTFYNINVINTDYGAIGNQQSPTTDVTVSNCIFMMPSSYSGGRAVYVYGTGSPNCDVMNCLTYNYSKDSGTGIHSGPRISNCITGNPLFTDAANGDFTLLEGSPALDAGTDGKGIGDPRWIPNIVVVLPEFNFLAPFVCDGPSAKLSGRISLDGENNMVQDNNSDASLHGTAKWKFHATGARLINVTLNMNATSTSGHRYKVELLDSDDNAIAEAYVEEPENSWAHTDIAMGAIAIPAEGDYAIKMSNSLNWSGSILTSITLTPVYTVAGVEALCGVDWLNDDASNDMSYSENAYRWTSGPVYYNGTATWEFKIAANHTWDELAFPVSNYSIHSGYKLTSGAGYYNVEIAYTPDPQAIEVTATYLYKKVEVAGTFNGWTLEELTYSPSGYLYKNIPVTAGDNEFKVIVNNVWQGNEGVMTRINCENWEFDPAANNSGLKADVDGSYTFYYQNDRVSVSYPTSFTRVVNNTNYQTLCVPFDAVKPENVAIYEVTDVSASSVTIGVPDIAYLEAGHSYIIKPEVVADIIINMKDEGNAVAAPIDTHMFGVLGATKKPTAAEGIYILSENEFHLVAADNVVTISSTRAYVKNVDPNAAPALRIVEAGNEATDIRNIEGNENAVKFIENGKLFIRKNGVVYDAVGTVVK